MTTALIQTAVQSSIQWWYPVVAWAVVVAAITGSVADRLAGRGGVRRNRRPEWFRWMPLAAGALSFLPVDGLPIGRWLHGFSPPICIPFCLLLAERVVRPLVGRRLIDARGERTAILFAVACGALLYPAALGSGAFDPYALGWMSPGVAEAAAVLGVVLLAMNNVFGLLVLVAGVGLRLGVLESSNAWDTLIDPVYFFSAALILIGDAAGWFGSRKHVGRAAVTGAVRATVLVAAAVKGFAAEDLASLIRSWDLPDPTDRCLLVRIEPSLVRPAGSDSPEDTAAWTAFVAARRARAESLFADAKTVAQEAVASGSVGRGCEAVRLLHRVLREDPDHAASRAACGWVRRGGRWVWPEVAARIDGGRSVADAESPRVRAENRGWKVTSDHWEIVSTADRERAVALAADLEHARLAWRQMFGGFEVSPEQLLHRITGTAQPRPEEPFVARLARSRAEYLAAFESREPAIGRTLGLYWAPTRTTWFVDPPDGVTVVHEATHQLFAERPSAVPTPGETCNFWAIEAAACFMESLEQAAFGWTLGGRDAGRAPAARKRLLEEDFYLPLADLCRMGRPAFQADERLPRIYGQLGGLADFFMTADHGRRRAAFLDLLGRVYAGNAAPDTLATLCGEPFADLDAAYRRHVAR